MRHFDPAGVLRAETDIHRGNISRCPDPRTANHLAPYIGSHVGHFVISITPTGVVLLSGERE